MIYYLSQFCRFIALIWVSCGFNQGPGILSVSPADRFLATGLPGDSGHGFRILIFECYIILVYFAIIPVGHGI